MRHSALGGRGHQGGILREDVCHIVRRRLPPFRQSLFEHGVRHLHIETAYIYDDLDVALPLRRLAELEAEGLIGRSAPSHYSFMGYLLDPTEFLEVSVPAIIERMRRESVDVAVFVPV